MGSRLGCRDVTLGHAFVEGRPAYAAPLACIVAARRRGTARTGLPLCCHSALQARDPTPPWELCRAWRVWETFHTTPGPSEQLAR